MVPSWRDALVPAAAAVATALPRRRGWALGTVALLTGAQLTVDHLRRHETPTHVIGVVVHPGDCPLLPDRALPIVNSALNGALLAVAWLAPTAVARRLPPRMGPSVNAASLLALRLAASVGADRVAARYRDSLAAGEALRARAARHPHVDDLWPPAD